MSQSETRQSDTLERRDFLKTGVAAVVGSATAGAGIAAARETSTGSAEEIATRTFGKTGVKLPILGYGGAALPKAWGNPLSTEDRVKLVRYAFKRGLRYFDTAGNYMESEPILGEALKGIRKDVHLVTKVETTDPAKVRAAVERSLAKLKTDYLDSVLIHGTPGLQQMSVERAMQVHAELVKLRDEKVIRYLGFSAHSYYDKALALISTGGFDQCMLTYGYIPRGYDQLYSPRMLELRNACLAKAHELGMAIVAMKVIAAGILGAWSRYIVPGFDRERLEKLPAAAIRFVMSDKRIHNLTIGMRLSGEIDANIKTLSGDLSYSIDDRALLSEFSSKAYESPQIKAMRID